MQFLENGPDIPNELLNAHEEGKVIFFCGAGISIPAGLPEFKDLVKKIYEALGVDPSVIEQNFQNDKKYDVTLNLLEQRVPGGLVTVRKELLNVLKPNLRRKGAIDTHASLLKLAHSRQGLLKLVTTNFDRIFEHVIKQRKLPYRSYSAPMLPIPNNSWDGLVYLHGLLPDKHDDRVLNQLVVTSGDFGRAYLTERWAARFISELFRNYIVCFVGYSINDPIMHYMMDALAASRKTGDIQTEAYILTDCTINNEHNKKIEWEAKGVTPIFYKTPSEHDHSALHKTLKTWAATYSDGVTGKEYIVTEYAVTKPSASTKQDDFVGRMIWALSDATGLPAKFFANYNPVPSLEWLEDLSKKFFQNMSVVSHVSEEKKWDAVMPHLAHWLTRHLNDPDLIVWLNNRGGRLHAEFARQINVQINRLTELMLNEQTDELKEIQKNAPNAIPNSPMLKTWHLLLAGQITSASNKVDLYFLEHWIKRGVSISFRLQLRSLLAPKVKLKSGVIFSEENNSEPTEIPEHIHQIFNVELILAHNHARSVLNNLNKYDHKSWCHVLPELFEEFQQLLRDALDLFCELGRANDKNDPSYRAQPSISKHYQNQNFDEWTALIEWVRDAWLAILPINPERAVQIAQAWYELPYPTFKRLALFAASQDNRISPDQWVDWLLVDHAWCLWSYQTKRETMRLLVLRGCHLMPQILQKLEDIILLGPPHDMFLEGSSQDKVTAMMDYEVWLRLAKLNQGQCILSESALQKMDSLSAKNPGWKLSRHEKEEFSGWHTGSGAPDFDDYRQIDHVPRKRKEIVSWLKEQSIIKRRDPFYENTWIKTCRTRFFHCAYALCDLAKEEIFLPKYWEEAVGTWREDGKKLRSWRFCAPLIQQLPNLRLKEIEYDIALWLSDVSNSILINKHESIFFDLCQRILNFQSEKNDKAYSSLTIAINHSVGHITEALLNIWLKREPNDNDQLPDEIKRFFNMLCDTHEVESFRYGREILASRVIALFRVDKDWTRQHLLPLFNWENSAEAKSAWEGFLWSPRFHFPLLIELKTHFLHTAEKYTKLDNRHGDFGRQYAVFLTNFAIHWPNIYSDHDFKTAISHLPLKGSEESLETLAQSLESAPVGTKEAFWENRIKPFYIKFWPNKSTEFLSGKNSQSFARLMIASGKKFPDTFSMLNNWLIPVENPNYVIDELDRSGLANHFPQQSLALLCKIIDIKFRWPSKELRTCLDSIQEKGFGTDVQYQHLNTYWRSLDNH